MLAENPYLGVSARIVEQYSRADGAFFPAAVQHVLGTLDPRIPGLGAWQPVEMSNGGDSAVVIDLSNYAFAGEPAVSDELTDAELDDLIDVLAEVEDEPAYDADYDSELSDSELEELMQAADDDYSGAAEQFDAAFSARIAADQAREEAHAAALVEDLIHPARRDEDRMQRIISRAQDGLYDGQQADFSSEQASVDIMLSNGGAGPCGPADEFGRCSARYHSTDCAHQVSVDWLASGPPAATGQAALSNLADRMALDLSRRSVWGDPDDEDEPGYEVPQATIELASALADEWGLHTDAPSFPQGAYADLMRMPAAPVSVYDELLDGAGLGGPPPQQQSLPQISELARTLGLK